MKKPISLMFVLGLGLFALPSIAQSHGDWPAPIQSSVQHDSAAPTITVPITPPPGVTAINAEKKDAKQQIDSSLPAKTKVSENMPPGGKIVVSNKDKQAAAALAVSVLPQGRQPTIPAAVNGRPTVCLALGGGGARGAAHIGVLRVLEREGIPVDYIVGNSMGAVVGGLYAGGVSLDQIETCMTDGSLQHGYVPGPIPPQVLAFPVQKALNVIHKHYAGLYSGKAFTKFLAKTLPDPDMNVQDTKIPFACIATNLIDGRAYKLSEGRLATAIKASSAISPILRPVPIGDKLYLDGGIRANLPAKAARETGAGIVIAVLVDEPLTKLPAKRFMHLRSIANRLIDVVLATTDERQLQYADIVLNPDVSGIPVFYKHNSDIVKAIQGGELAAEKALPQIREQLKHPHTQSSVASTEGKGAVR